MKRLVLAILFLLVPVYYTATLCAKTIYVSSSEGSDVNDGLRIDKPLKTIAKAIVLKSDTILLKAGDVFYENLVAVGVNFGKYGEGANPTLCGYKRPIGVKWEKWGRKTWRMKLCDDENFSGCTVKSTAILNNLGGFHEYDSNAIHGRKVEHMADLSKDWDFYQTEHFERNVAPSEFDNVYLYLDSDPNELKLEFISGLSAGKIENAKVENLNFEGFGFGLSCGTKCTVRGCRLDVMGGRTMLGNANFISYGNGIEFWIGTSKEDCIVEDCYISRCYDCGITIQGSNAGRAKPENIIIRKNLIVNCCQGWEDFLRNDEDIVFKDCIFKNNIVVFSGDSGFGYPDSRFKYCHVLGNNTKGDKGMRIEGNTFIGGNFYCSGAYKQKYASNVWRGNVCYIEPNNFLLSNYNGTRDVVRTGKNDSDSKDAIEKYRKLTGDTSTKFKVVTPEKISTLAQTNVNTFLKSHKY